MPTKVTFVIERLAGMGGGAERVLIETANSLHQRGYIVEVISHEYSRLEPVYFMEKGIELINLRDNIYSKSLIPLRLLRRVLHKFHSCPFLRHIAWYSRNGMFWRRLERYLSQSEPEVVIAFMPPAISALALSRTSAVKIGSTHNVPVQDYENPDRWDPSKLDQKRRLMLAGEMDKLLVLFPSYANYYSEEVQKKITNIPNFAPSTVGFIPRRQREVIAVSRLENVKRLPLLIDAWSLLESDFPAWRLRIFGEGRLRRQLEKRIQHHGLRNVDLLGHTSNIRECFETASILAHPAEYEGFPLAVLEALSLGVPAVGFKGCSGLNQLVEHEANGILVDDDDGATAERLAAGLSLLMTDEARLTRMSAESIISVEQYNREIVMDLWEKTIMDLLGRN